MWYEPPGWRVVPGHRSARNRVTCSRTAAGTPFRPKAIGSAGLWRCPQNMARCVEGLSGESGTKNETVPLCLVVTVV